MVLPIARLGKLFMGLNRWKLTAICAVSVLCTNLAYAERSGFYTIIGPDGRVMVIDRSATDAKKSAGNPAKYTKAVALPSNSPNPPAALKAPSIQADKALNEKALNEKALGDNAQVTPHQPMPQADLSNQAKANQTKNNQLGKDQSGKNQSDSNQPKSLQSGSQVAGINAKAVPRPASNSPAPPSKPIEAENQSGLAEDQSANPVTIIDGEQYIDSEYLEQREFNLEGKKRFYSLPDGIGGTQVLQREKGVDMSVFKQSKIEQPQIVSLAKNYQRIAKEQVVDLIGMQCFSQKQLKKPKLLHKTEPLNLWPRSGFEPKFDFVVAEFQEQINDIQLTSYTDNMANPKFYWPLPIFLDSDGCVIEGVNSFYQSTVLPTVTTHQAIQGYLHVPAGTRYMVLTPLEAAADLVEIQLTNKGQVRLTPIR